MDIPKEDITGRWFKYRDKSIIYIIGWDVFNDTYVCMVDNSVITSFIYPYHWKDLEPYEC